MSRSTTGTRTISLQWLLAILPALGILPLVAFALVLLQLLWNTGESESQRELQQTAGTLAVAVDREIHGTIRELRRLAEFPALEAEALEDFHRYASGLVERNEGWLNLTIADLDGRVLVDAGSAFGHPAVLPGRALLDRVLDTGAPALSDVHPGMNDGEPAISVAVPVLRSGQVVWVLSARLDPSALSQLIGRQLQREGSIAAVFDRNRLIVARSREAERFFGQPITADLEKAARAQPERGSARLWTLDRQQVLTAWERMPSGWTVVIGVSVGLHDMPLRRSIATLVGFGALILGLGVLLSVGAGRRISAAIDSLALDARALAAGRAIAPRSSRVTQVAALFGSLAEASRLQRENAQARDQAVVALQASEQRLQLAIDATEAGTFDWDLDSGRVEWSARARELLGLADDVPGRIDSYYRAVHPDDRRAVQAAVAAALSGQHDGRLRIEHRVQRGTVDPCWVEMRAQAHADRVAGTRRRVRLVGIVIDQTERQQRVEALREADRRKDEFLAMLAHELRNPLAPLRNAVALLERGVPQDGPARRALEMSARQVRHMTRLVNDLLDVSRITQGKIDLRREPVRVADAIGQALDAIRPMIERRGQRLGVRLPAQPATILVDGVRIAQVLENLLSNASKYTDPGGAIDLEVDIDADGITIRVRDTGIGLAPDQLSRVFDMFTQVDETLDRAQGGLGIGLSLVKRLVELHGGSVSAHSDGAGRGACFVVRLPRHPEAEGF